jgi:dienelactone hydrolase
VRRLALSKRRLAAAFLGPENVMRAFILTAILWATGCGSSGATIVDPGSASDPGLDIVILTDPGDSPDLPEIRDLLSFPDVADLVEPAEASPDLASVPLPDALDANAPDPLPDPEPDPDPVPEPVPDPGPDLPADSVSPPPPLFDHPAIRDASTALCTFTGSHTTLAGATLVEAWNVSYLSWEVIDGQLHPILIRGFAARPAGSGSNLPGVIQAHGLGGLSREDHATSLAARLGMFVLAYTGPGGGDSPDNTSEGLPAMTGNGKRLFDTIPDPRGSWFWGHAVAAMRGLTCLGTRPEVDAQRLGITGFSAGGVISLVLASVDDRVKAAVPLSGTGAWGVATLSPTAWQHDLLSKAGLDTSSPEWTTLLATIVPDVLVPGAKAKILMADGTTDEFFPLTAFQATYDPIPGIDKRVALVANFDHGCYSLTGVENAKTIEDRAALHAEGGQRFWFRHWFATDSDFSTLPQAPAVQVSQANGLVAVTAAVDPAGYEVESVRFWWSGDDCFVFAGVDLDAIGGGAYGKVAPATLPPNAVWFVDVQYRTKALLFPERFALSSPPSIPAGLVPHIRKMGTCL